VGNWFKNRRQRDRAAASKNRYWCMKFTACRNAMYQTQCELRKNFIPRFDVI
jgi:hypothetical protein